MRALLAAALLAVLAGPPARAADDAVLEGRVQGQPRVVIGRGQEEAYEEREGRYARLFDYEHLKDVVVYAEPVSSAAAPAPSADPAVLVLRSDRRGPRAVPEFLAAPAGGRLVVRNETDAALSLYAAGASAGGLQLTVGPKASAEARLDETGPYWLYALEAPELKARVFAAGPYFAVADKRGLYSLKLPPGTYRVTAWHWRLPPQTKTVTLKSGEEGRLDFLLSVRGLPEVK